MTPAPSRAPNVCLMCQKRAFPVNAIAHMSL